MADQTKSNVELSVSELSAALKRTVEDNFGYVRVRGEISNYRGPHSSGHAYFDLKDPFARISGVVWKGAFGRLRTKPAEGLEVIASGKITTFAANSKYQLIVEALEPAGIGALMALVEERRRQLAAEGLFNEDRKRPLPFLPKSIGVITSPAGAAIRDILHRIAERFPRHVFVWPVRVQGESSASEIAAAIEGFNALPESGPLSRPDVIIVARGGGSLEDLWSFNEEIVVRAAVRSLVPLISAVGHETDWTLIDHAADLRAPTPTAAAEKAVPVRSHLAGQLAGLGRRQEAAALRYLDGCRNALRVLARALPQRDRLIADRGQQLDSLEARLAAAHSKATDRLHLGVARLSHRLAQQSPHAKVAQRNERLRGLARRLQRCQSLVSGQRKQALSHAAVRLANARTARLRLEDERLAAARLHLNTLAQRMRNSLAQGVAFRRERVRAAVNLFASLDYHQVLARGFALVRGEDSRLLRRAEEIADGTLLDIEFADGRKAAIAGRGGKRKRAQGKNGRSKQEQSSLF
ncbi:MAG: exodeoxyribonuclease VII large subunit [Methylocapsa sp.]|nr:exodeoxyribonuclease VII large subunit [Methylocapsa sp.]